MVAMYVYPYCGTCLPVPGKDEEVNEDSWQHLRLELSPQRVQELLAHCPAAHETPLVAAPTLAKAAGIAAL
jgi:hypothetical protein